MPRRPTRTRPPTRTPPRSTAARGTWRTARTAARGSIWAPSGCRVWTACSCGMETGGNGSVVTAAAVTVEGSSLQVQVFAAPRTAGIWDEIRSEIGESVTKQGGSVDDLPGPFGRELLARLPVRTPEGRTGHRPARFIGADGPRWFLRGVVTGRAAVDPEAARVLEDLFADIVVVRGAEARAPRELLAADHAGREPGPTGARRPWPVRPLQARSRDHRGALMARRTPTARTRHPRPVLHGMLASRTELEAAEERQQQSEQAGCTPVVGPGPAAARAGLRRAAQRPAAPRDRGPGARGRALRRQWRAAAGLPRPTRGRRHRARSTAAARGAGLLPERPPDGLQPAYELAPRPGE